MARVDYLSKIITISEASRRFKLSEGHLRRLMGEDKIRGRKADGTWLLDFDSLLRYLKSPRRPGPKPKHTRA